MDYIRVNPVDTVAVALRPLSKGAAIKIEADTLNFVLADDIPQGHKFALRDIKSGDDVIKYGYPIGIAVGNIACGDHVHTHNVKTKLSGVDTYTYNPKIYPLPNVPANRTFKGYPRPSGEVGIRNEIWIILTVGCVNEIGRTVRNRANERFGARRFDGVQFFPHPYGCSQLGDDHNTTQKILADLASHPNSGGVLILGLGCENNTIKSFKQILGDYDPQRVQFLAAQEAEDEIESALEILEALVENCEKDQRLDIPVSKLRVGLKCGGSDGLSGITANPLLGAFSDMLIAAGGTSILTEVPEMFGAETILMNRCESEAVFQKVVAMINGFKNYYERHNQVIYENPSPGNKEGGITTLEDKSLGCVQKGGLGTVVDVLRYGERLQKTGLNLLEGPGNDIVSVTALAASHVHLTLFSTGRGTPLGSPVPIVKVSTNSILAARKKQWIDFNAGDLVENKTIEGCAACLFEVVLSIASGTTKTKNEINDYRGIAIFKDGVTL